MALLPKPLFDELISTFKPSQASTNNPKGNSRIKAISILLITIRQYMANNINKRVDTILEVWEVATTSAILSLKINSSIEYLQKDLENDEMFYKEALTTISMKVSIINETQRKEQNFPSKGRIKQLKAYWKERTKTL